MEKVVEGLWWERGSENVAVKHDGLNIGAKMRWRTRDDFVVVETGGGNAAAAASAATLSTETAATAAGPAEALLAACGVRGGNAACGVRRARRTACGDGDSPATLIARGCVR